MDISCTQAQSCCLSRPKRLPQSLHQTFRWQCVTGSLQPLDLGHRTGVTECSWAPQAVSPCRPEHSPSPESWVLPASSSSHLGMITLRWGQRWAPRKELRVLPGPPQCFLNLPLSLAFPSFDLEVGPDSQSLARAPCFSASRASCLSPVRTVWAPVSA